jgi:putative peptidoglycan lipid II flippase
MDGGRQAADRQRGSAQAMRAEWNDARTSAEIQPDEQDLNPPWDHPSGQLPAAQARKQKGNADDALWQFESAAQQSLPGLSISEMTGTGKMPAVVPLPGSSGSWSKGISAPNGAAAHAPVVEEEVEQPSAQMRALRVGNLARATAIVTAALLLSRALGLLRTSLFAYTFGSGIDADAFTNAFALPDTIFTIVAGGALASAFIPVFTDYLIEKRDRKTAWHIASSAFNIIMLALTLFAALAFFFTPQFLRITLYNYFTPGNPEGPIIVHLTRIMLLQPIFLGGATVAVSILQARQRFVLPAIGSVIYTVSLIGGILATIMSRRYGLFGGDIGIDGPAWGVVVGALLQLVIQIPGLFTAKMEYRLAFDIFHPGVREMFRLMAPRMLNSALLFVSVFINRDLLGSLDVGAAYGYVTAFTLVMLPIGVFGMAVSQAAFPTLAALVSAGEWKRLRDTIMRTVRGVTYLAVPSALGMIVLATPLSALILAHGAFSKADIPLVSNPLIFFSIGLLGLALVEILTRSFYALHDSRTPVEVSILQFMFVIGMSIILLHPMGASGLALATSLGALGEALVLLLLLRPRLHGLQLRPYWLFLVNVLAASVVTALAALFVYTFFLVVLPVQANRLIETIFLAIRLLGAVSAATVIYFAFSRYLGIDKDVSIDRILRRVFRR